MRLNLQKGYTPAAVKVGGFAVVWIVALVGAATYLNIRSQREEILTLVMKDAAILCESLQNASRTDRLLHASDRLQLSVESMGRQPSVQSIRVFNGRGRVAYSTDTSELNRLLDPQAEPCIGCHLHPKPLESLPISERARIVTSPAGQRSLRMISPILNEPDCSNTSCHTHSPHQKVLGVLEMLVSLQSVDESLRTAEIRLGFVALGLIVALSAMILALVNRFVSLPLTALLERAQHGANRAPDDPLRVPSDDEYGLIGELLTRMSGELEEARASLAQWGCQFEQMVCDRTHDLQEAQHQLIQSEKLASLGKLSAGIAHEINNPLTGILNLSQLLLDQAPPESDLYEDLKLIVRETIRCRSIVRGLLDFARQTAPQKTLVDVNASIQQVLHIVTNQESFQNVRVETDLDQAIPRVLADPDQLRQVFFNIVVNASEAMGGNGHLVIMTHWEQNLSQIAIRCLDDGPGIPEAIQDRLFDPFFTTKEMGTGLGLAITHGIVHAHHGTLKVNNRAEGGCEVIVTLPSDPSQGAEPEAHRG